jgi:cytidine deaminase
VTPLPSARELIAEAAAHLNPVRVGVRVFGDVASTLVTDRGARYSGMCVDTGTSGFCAEQAAIAAMVTAGEYRIARIVAVWGDWEDGDGALHVLSPCGVCRELIFRVDPSNAATEVVLGPTEITPLRDLLPMGEWPAPLDDDWRTP